MKPSFALSLSFDGIRLLHRAVGGWRVVGDVALDATDMSAELEMLRNGAKSLEPGTLFSKVLLPNEQIKYLTIDTPDQDDAARRAAAIVALEGATPYPVADLAFDISLEGDKTHIAAVAKETLAEAEAFATEHQFNPVSFAAVPGDQTYLGEPSFGTSSNAQGILGPDVRVEPDGIAVVVIGDVAPTLPDEEPQAVSPADETSIEEVEEAPPAPHPETVEFAPIHDTPDDVSSAPQEQQEPQDAVPIAAETANTDEVVEPPLQEPTATAPVGFASRRTTDTGNAPQLGGASRSASFEESARASDPPLSAAVSVTAGELAIAPESPPPNVQAAPSPPPPPPVAAPAIQSPPSSEPKAGFLSRRRAKNAATAPIVLAPGSAQSAIEDSEQERMTVFGARKAQVGGKPRFLGLILTAALLVLLAGVAAWASVFLDDGLKLSKLFGTRAPELANVTPAPLDFDTLPEPKIVTASLDPSLSEEDAAVLDALRAPELPTFATPPSDTELEASYAASGIWPRAPVVPPEPAGLVDIDDFYLTNIDPVSTSTDAIALPSVDAFATDTVLASVSSPAAAGTQFALDPQGLVIPTVAGALSPDGFTVYLGRPPLEPPVIPTRFRTAPEDTANPSPLARLRPSPRPRNLIENTERAQLGGLTRRELAAIRPALRPQSLQQKAEAALEQSSEPQDAAVPPEITDGAVQLALTTPVENAPKPIENATRLAVRASVRPDTRPRNFARIVRRAQRAKPTEEVRVASAAAIAPRVVQPKIPSNASVAQQATVKNAINLRQVNLIGVYGKPSNRRALVRLGNGRYKKVVVGDRIDGGRVSAIGEGELRYNKRGRDLVLKMPR
ncbi:MAG: hypothetical protein ABJL67_23100 [Sulfitobacter sp.]